MELFKCSLLLLFSFQISLQQTCDEVFEGFGIYLGSNAHFSNSRPSVIPKVFNSTYNDLGIRYYRTAYESNFSPSRHIYEISCSDPKTCAYIAVHHEISKYPNISLMASIWSPPHYMKNNVTNTLIVAEEPNYYHFLKNITQLLKDQFNLTVEKISPVNEPENIVAPWEHTNMSPQQLCRMVSDFNDSLISICPENSYFWISEAYSNVTDNANVTCLEACEIFGTHAYALNLENGEDNLLAYYDPAKYRRKVPGMPIWQTEVSSTYWRSDERQMEEALDMSVNIINLLGFSCIQRYYFWLSYTLYSSGESLMWGNSEGELTYPKKYFAYKHFTKAAAGGSKRIGNCGPDETFCIKFDEDKAVFVHKENSTNDSKNEHWNEAVNCKIGTLCCTFEENDWNCDLDVGSELPAQAICSCDL